MTTTAGQTEESETEVMGTALGRGRQGKDWLVSPPGDKMLGDGKVCRGTSPVGTPDTG